MKGRVTAKTKFELGQVTAQRVLLLLPSLIDNIYFVNCIRLIQSYLRLTSHSVTIDTSGTCFACIRFFLAIIVLVVIPILPGRASVSGLTRGS